MAQNISQMTATGTFSDASTSNITSQVAWSISDTSIVTIGGSTGIVAVANAGKIWGADVGVTATLAPGTPGVAAMNVIASDSGSAAPLMPQQNNHWQVLGLSPWGAYGGCQEPTGNLVLSGSAGYTLTPVSVAAQPPLQFQVPVPAWLRSSVWISGSGGRFNAAAGVGPDPSVTSMAMLGYIAVAPGAAGVQLFGLGAAAAGNRLLFSCDSSVGFTGQIDCTFNANIRRLVGPLTTRHASRVHPFLLVYNKTANETWAFTDQCLTMSGSAPVQVDGTKMFGGNNNFCASASMVYYASCTGSVAESYANIRRASPFLAVSTISG